MELNNRYVIETVRNKRNGFTHVSRLVPVYKDGTLYYINRAAQWKKQFPNIPIHLDIPNGEFPDLRLDMKKVFMKIRRYVYDDDK